MTPVYVLDLREQEVGGAVTSGHLFVADDQGLWDADGEGLAAFSSLTRGRDILVLLHGYNNTRNVGREALLRFARFLDTAGVTALMLAVLWPGDGWAKALTYPAEGKDADDSAESLVAWLQTHADGTARISLVAHSLGCRVAMVTALRFAEWAGPGIATLGRVCLMAPAIDNDSLGRTGSTCYRGGTLALEQLAVLASAEDRVLKYAYPIGDLAQTILYFGDRWGTALGRTGPVERDPAVLAKLEAIPLSHPRREVDHGDYLGVRDHDATHTIADADAFVASFLRAAPPHVWTATR